MKKGILLFSFLCLLSCSNDDNLPIISACNVANPIEDLAWLREQVVELKKTDSDLAQYFYIEQAEYQNESIFISNNCCPFCNTIVPIYNCSGETIGLLGDEDFNLSNISNRTIIYRPSDFNCEIN
jgi:hypothetical protein